MLKEAEVREEDVLKGIELLQEKGYILRSDIMNLNSRPYSRSLRRELEERMDCSVNSQHVEVDMDYYEVIYLWDFKEKAIREAKSEILKDMEESKKCK